MAVRMLRYALTGKIKNRKVDVVNDLGAVGKEPMVRLLAHRGVDAAGMAVEIAGGCRSGVPPL